MLLHSRTITVYRDGQPIADMLLIERFDRPLQTQDETNSNTRLHRLSMFAMTNPDEVKSQDGGDYMHMVDILRKSSTNYQEDVRELFRRMVLNVGINNTDDHLKNFEMIYSKNEGGYRLAPAFDIVPTAYPYQHVTSICGLIHGSLTDDFITRSADRFGIPAEEAKAIRDKVAEAINKWPEILEEAKCSKADIAQMQKAVNYSGLKAKILYGMGEGQPDPIKGAKLQNEQQGGSFELQVQTDSRRSAMRLG